MVFPNRPSKIWKKIYANLETAEVKRIKQMDKENRQLKQLAGDQSLDIQILQENIFLL
jgi:hypothetical protein